MSSELLFAAVRSRDVAAVERLLAAGADVNAVRRYTAGGERTEVTGIQSVLHAAVAAGDAALVVRLLARGARPDVRDEADGRTPLLQAVHMGDVAMVRALLAAGASPEPGEAPSGDDALCVAVARGDAAVEHALWAAGARPTARLAEIAGSRGRADLFERCTAAGFQVAAGDAMGAACRFGQVAAVQWLLQRGFDIAADGVEALCEAVNARQAAVVDVLLAAGADVNGANSYRWTPLHFAAWVGDAALVARLLAAGARPDAVDGQGRTPASWAEEAGHAAIVAALQARGG